MPFLGKQPTSGFSTIVKDDLTADGSTTAFTLSKNVASANDIAVFVGNVRQEPTDAYTVSGTTLTMSAAPSSGVNFYVLHIVGVVESSTVPAAGTTVPGNFGVSGDLTVDSIKVDTAVNIKSGGVTVGNIGYGSNGIGAAGPWIGNDTSGRVVFANNDGGVIPWTNGVMDLGNATAQYKRLWVSEGVVFGGDVTNNYLDDYEEGEWTPVIVGSTSGTATGSAGAGAGGSYKKIGNHVWLQFYFANPSISGTMSGDLYLNLPFTNANNDQYDNGSGGEINTHRYFNSGSTSRKITMRIVRGENKARFRVQDLGSNNEDGPLNQSTAALNGSTLIWGQLQMRV